MTIRIAHDKAAPTTSIELMITKPLPDYDLEDVEAPIPRDVDPMLASQGFLDLLDETRAHSRPGTDERHPRNRSTHRRHLPRQRNLPSGHLAGPSRTRRERRNVARRASARGGSSGKNSQRFTALIGNQSHKIKKGTAHRALFRSFCCSYSSRRVQLLCSDLH